MLKFKKKLAGRLLSLILALIIITMSATVAFAATELTSSNIVTYPTVEGTIHYGEVIGEKLKLNGGEVQYNGVKVDGEFQFVDPNALLTGTGSRARADIKFVPSNSDEYTGFTESRSRNVTYAALVADLVLVDENNPPIATVPQNSTLSEATVTGGQVMNKYNPEMEDALAATWSWSDPTTVVSESGYYEAYIFIAKYNKLISNIYVEAKASKSETVISTTPTISEFTYDPHITWADIKLEGGKAVVSGSDTEVEGTFAIASKWLTTVPTAGSYEIDATFTPNDTEAYTSVNFTIPVTVTAASMSFKTEDGGMPVITVPFTTKMANDVTKLLVAYVPAEYEATLSFADFEGKYLPHYNTTPNVGEHEFEVKIDAKSSNYLDTMLTFKLIVEPVTITPILEGTGDRMIIRVPGKVYDVNGTFDIYADDVLVLTDVAFGQYFTYNYEKSGDIVLKAVYKPGTDNRYIINDIVRVDEGVKLSWNVAIGETSTKYTYGDIVELNAPSYDTSRKYPIYGFAGWEVLEGDPGLSEEELKNETISFEMPDGNLKLEPTYRFSFKLMFEWIWQQIARFFSFIASVFSELIGMAFAK